MDDKIIQSPSKQSEMLRQCHSAACSVCEAEVTETSCGVASIATIFEQFSSCDKLVQPTIEKRERGSKRQHGGEREGALLMSQRRMILTSWLPPSLLLVPGCSFQAGLLPR